MSIQETLYPDLTCFGCGHANHAGLQLRSYRDAGRTIASVTLGPGHDNGFGFGCGHANHAGLQLRSYRDADRTIASVTPGPGHDNGFGFVNGGILSTLLDCHTGAVVSWEGTAARTG